MKRCHRRSAIPSVPALSLDGNGGGPGPDYCCHCHGGVSKVHWETGEMETATETLGTGKLFYIIPRHNRANLSVCTHVHREERQHYTVLCVFSRFTFGTFLWISLNIDFMEKKNLPLVSGSRSQHSQPCLAIIVMNSGGAAGPRHPEN